MSITSLERLFEARLLEAQQPLKRHIWLPLGSWHHMFRIFAVRDVQIDQDSAACLWAMPMFPSSQGVIDVPAEKHMQTR